MEVRVKEPRTILPDRVIAEQSTLYSITGEMMYRSAGSYWGRRLLVNNAESETHLEYSDRQIRLIMTITRPTVIPRNGGKAAFVYTDAGISVIYR